MQILDRTARIVLRKVAITPMVWHPHVHEMIPLISNLRQRRTTGVPRKHQFGPIKRDAENDTGVIEWLSRGGLLQT